ncbi:MAG: hypothetical protein ACK4F9_04855 [Brevinematia bacterium]
MSRRSRELNIQLPKRSLGNMKLVVDITG